MIALTHIVSPHIARCELSHLARRPIDHGGGPAGRGSREIA